MSHVHTSRMCVPLLVGVSIGLSSTPIETGSKMERAVSSSLDTIQENNSKLSTEQWRVVDPIEHK